MSDCKPDIFAETYEPAATSDAEPVDGGGAPEPGEGTPDAEVAPAPAQAPSPGAAETSSSVDSEPADGDSTLGSGAVTGDDLPGSQQPHEHDWFDSPTMHGIQVCRVLDCFAQQPRGAA